MADIIDAHLVGTERSAQESRMPRQSRAQRRRHDPRRAARDKTRTAFSNLRSGRPRRDLRGGGPWGTRQHGGNGQREHRTDNKAE